MILCTIGWRRRPSGPCLSCRFSRGGKRGIPGAESQTTFMQFGAPPSAGSSPCTSASADQATAMRDITRTGARTATARRRGPASLAREPVYFLAPSLTAQPALEPACITDEASPLVLRSTRNRSEEAMHQGCVARANEGGEGSGGVVADIAKLSMGREEYYTRELATDHERICPATVRSPGRWYGAGATSLGLQGEASVAGFQTMFEGRDPTTGELLGRPHGRNAVPAFDVVLRPTKSVSILYGLGDPATGRAVLAAHHVGVREAVGYLDGHLGARRGHGGIQHVSGQGLLAVGFDHRTSREGDPCCTPTWSSPTACRARTDAGQPWTAGTCTGIGWLPMPSIGPATSVSSSGHWGWNGQRRTPTATGNCRACRRSWSGCSPSAPTRSTWPWSGWQRPVGSGHRGWSSGPSMPPARPRSTRPPDTLYGRWRTEAAERGVDADALVRQVTDRTQDARTVSEWTVAAMFDRLASPDGLTAPRPASPARTSSPRSAASWPGPPEPSVHPGNLPQRPVRRRHAATGHRRSDARAGGRAGLVQVRVAIDGAPFTLETAEILGQRRTLDLRRACWCRSGGCARAAGSSPCRAV